MNGHTILFGNLDSVMGFFQTGSGDHHLKTSNIHGPFHHIVEVIFMCLFAVVYASKDWVPEVDPNLGSSVKASAGAIRSSIHARLHTSRALAVRPLCCTWPWKFCVWSEKV